MILPTRSTSCQERFVEFAIKLGAPNGALVVDFKRSRFPASFKAAE